MAEFSLDPTNSGYGDDRTAHIITESITALRRIPGVTSVAATPILNSCTTTARPTIPSRVTSPRKTRT